MLIDFIDMSHHHAGYFDFPTAPYRPAPTTKNTSKELSSSYDRVVTPKRPPESPQHIVPNWLLSDHNSLQDTSSKHKKWEPDYDKHKSTHSPSLPALLQLRDENPNFPITLPPPLPSPYQFVPLSSSSEFTSPTQSPSSAFPSPRLPDFFHPHSPVTSRPPPSPSHSYQNQNNSHEPVKPQPFSPIPSSPNKHDLHHRQTHPASPNPLELLQSDPYIHAIPPKSIPYFRPELANATPEYGLGSRRSELHHNSYSEVRRTAFRPLSGSNKSPHSPLSPPSSYSPPLHSQHPPQDEPPPYFVPQEFHNLSIAEKFQSVPVTLKSSFPPSSFAHPKSPTLSVSSPQRTSPPHPQASLSNTLILNPFISNPGHGSHLRTSSSVPTTPPTPTGHQPQPRKLYQNFEENEYNVRMQNANTTTVQLVSADHKPSAQRRPRADKTESYLGQKEKVGKEKRRRLSNDSSMSEEPSDRQDSKPTRYSRLSTNSNKLYCTCENPRTKASGKCIGCDKLFHLECSGTFESDEYVCHDCKYKKIRSDDPVAKTPSPTFKEVSEPADQDDEEEENGIRIGSEVVSLSTIAKQPWLDGWATARNFAVEYLQEAKGFLGNNILENRKLPKQIEVRNASKGRRAWRQAEVLLAIQFLKTAELVDTSTKKGTTVRMPYKTMDELIKKVQSVAMPTVQTNKRAYSVW